MENHRRRRELDTAHRYQCSLAMAIVIDPSNVQTVDAGTGEETCCCRQRFRRLIARPTAARASRRLAGIATDVVFDPVSPSTVHAALGSVAGNAANGVYR